MTKEEMLLEYPCGYDLSHAAIIAGCHANTILYAIQHQHLYPFRTVTGTRKIAPAELARWIQWRDARAENE